MKIEIGESLMYSCSTIPTSVGRLDGKTSAYYSMVDTKKIIELIKESDFIFNQTPFKDNALVDALKEFDEICIEFMFGDELNQERHRTFNGNRISALQQGADSVDESKKKYKGDAYVIVNQNKPCLQVFNIVPEFNDVPNYTLRQYMYSFHFPVSHSAFVKK